jgi:peptidoglycan/LPS O-acetylase OafA/YrhL
MAIPTKKRRAMPESLHKDQKDVSCNRLVTLDGLRGVAALMIVLLHVGYVFRGAGIRLPNAYIAVDFFFCLSGFVMEKTYGVALARGTLGWRDFMRGRLTRLYPVYLLGLMGGAGVLSASGQPFVGTVSGTIAQAALVPFPGSSLYPFDPPAWSLADELLVNLAFALMARRLGTRRLAAGIAAALLALIAVGWSRVDLDAGWDMANCHIGVARAVFSFAVGVLLCRCGGPRISSSAGAWTCLAALVAALAISAPPGATLLWSLLLIALVCPALVRIAASIEPTGYTRALFSWAGRISYPLYLTHVATAWVTISLWKNRASVAGVLAAALVVAYLAARYYEPWARRHLARLLTKRDARELVHEHHH